MSPLLFTVLLSAEPSWVGLAPQKLTLHTSADYPKHVLEIARHFIGAPYVFSPLGEGEGHPPDADPLFRTDEFDCLSLVETSMALASTDNMQQAMERLRQIRYTDGRVEFAYRNHFPESQWIPENEKKGFIKDITREVGGELAVPVQKTVTLKSYEKRKKTLDIDLPVDRIPNGTFRWWMIPIDKMEEVMAKIPSGALIFVVREDYASIPYRISHVGIIAQHRGGTMILHAKEDTAHQVVEMMFADVIHRHMQFVKWPAAGFSVFLPKNPP